MRAPPKVHSRPWGIHPLYILLYINFRPLSTVKIYRCRRFLTSPITPSLPASKPLPESTVKTVKIKIFTSCLNEKFCT